MQTVRTLEGGTVTARRVLFGFDLEVKNPEGETIATVFVTTDHARDLFGALGEELAA